MKCSCAVGDVQDSSFYDGVFYGIFQLQNDLGGLLNSQLSN